MRATSASRCRHRADDPALEHHRDAVGDLEQLLEVLADHDHAAAARAEPEQLVVDEGARRDVEAARRLRGDQHQGLERELAGEQRLLQVAARERAGARLRPGRADRELLDLGGDEAPRRAVVEDAAAAERALADAGEDHAVGERQRPEQAGAEAVLGHVRDAEPAHRAGAARGDRPAGDLDPPARGRERAADHLGELALAVARDADDAEDLAAAHGEGDLLERHRMLGRAPCADLIQRQQDRPRRHLVPHRRRELVAAHQHGEAARGQAVVVARLGDHRALAHHHDAVGDPRTSPSLWLMKITPKPCACERFDRGEQAQGLLRGQDRGRLVEDQHAGAAVERLDDLEPLLLADAERADRARPGRAAGRSVRRSRRAARARPARSSMPAPPGQADHQVLEHAVARHQVEVLVDHADAGGERVGGAADRHGRAVDPDLAGIRPVEAEQDVHQRGLAGAVLAEQAHDLAGVRRARSTARLACTAPKRLSMPRSSSSGAGMGAVYSERGVLSSTGTRKVPSMISCVRSATMVLTSAGSLSSQAW